MTQDSNPHLSGAAEAGRSTDEIAELRSANRIRRVVAVVTLAGSALFLYASWGLSVGTMQRPGAGLMPRLVALGLLASAALALLERVRPGAELDPLPERDGARRQGLVLLVLAGYAVAIPLVGFLVSSAVAMSVIAWSLNDSRNVKRALVIGVTLAVVIDLVFRLLLDVSLPAGVWDIRTA